MIVKRKTLLLLPVVLFSFSGCHSDKNSEYRYDLKIYPERYSLNSHWKRITIGNEMRTATALSSGEMVCFADMVPSHAQLEFAFGVRSEEKDRRLGKGTLLVEVKEGKSVLFEKSYGNIGYGWH